MINTELSFVGILFTIWSVLLVIATIHNIRNRGIHILVFIDAFYAIIYGITPATICLYVAKTGYTGFPLNQIKFNGEYITYLYYFLISSIIVFAGIRFGYIIKQKEKEPVVAINQAGVHTAAVFLMIIGWISLLLWTKAYGSPIGILPYANALRAGRDVGIYNPFSFMMKLCPFLQFASYLFFSYYLTNKRLSDLLYFIISGIGSFIYILANSSRMHFVLFFVILFIIYSGHKSITRKTVLLFGILGVVAFSVMHVSEGLLGYFQGYTSSDTAFTLNIMEVLRSEFFFPVASFQTCMDAIHSNKVGMRLFIDIANAFFAWLPSKFKPIGLEGLEATNTLLHSGTTIYGGLPTDFVTTCYYELRLLGIFVFPIIYGYLARKFENTVHVKTTNDYYKVIYILGVFYFVKAIGYGDPSNIMNNIFYLVWGHLFTILICKLRLNTKRGI